MDDYIKRSDAIYLANNSILLSIDANDIARIPAADVRGNARGRWEEKHFEDCEPWFRRRFCCSECGDWQTYGKTPFCPYCGAEMEPVEGGDGDE